MSNSAPSRPPRPDAGVAARVEELLREQLGELGVRVSALEPHEIAAGMSCEIGDDNSLTYSWKGVPLLHVSPEIIRRDGEDVVRWRMFTRDDPETGPDPATT